MRAVHSLARLSFVPLVIALQLGAITTVERRSSASVSTGEAALPKELTRALVQVRKAEPADVAKALQAVLEIEREAARAFVKLASDRVTRPTALAQVEAADPELAARLRAELPASKTSETEVAAAVAPWIAGWLAKPCNRELQARFDELAGEIRAAQRTILATAPFDATDDWKRKAEAFATWDAARTAALAAIFDTKLYPDADHGAAGQPVVDAKVKAAWNAYRELARFVEADAKNLAKRTPEEWTAFLARIAALRDALEKAREVLAGRAGVAIEIPGDDAMRVEDARSTPARPAFARGLVLAYAGKDEEARPSLEVGGPYVAQLLRLVRGQRTLDANQAEFDARKPRDDPEEAKVERLIGEYRLSLGLGALVHDARLYACARGHSEEEAKLGYYGHESPVAEHKTSHARAMLAGYPEPGVTECIAQCGKVQTGRAVFLMWYGSSPHHRLMLLAEDRDVGVGRSGPYFTANIGRAPASSK